MLVAAVRSMNDERSLILMAYMEVSPTLEELQARIATIRARMEKAALESEDFWAVFS